LNLIRHLGGNITRLALTLMLLGITAVSLAACGGTEATPTPTVAAGGATGGTGSTADVTPTTAADQGGSSSGSGAAQEVKATLNEWSVSLNADQVSAGTVKFIVSNEGQNSHDLVVMDSSGTEIGATPSFKKDDGAKELVVDLKPGTYTIVCNLPGHTEKGMKTTLNVK
jgi:uncharacterized cupredoxin-like copper-binding protein